MLVMLLKKTDYNTKVAEIDTKVSNLDSKIYKNIDAATTIGLLFWEIQSLMGKIVFKPT